MRIGKRSLARIYTLWRGGSTKKCQHLIKYVVNDKCTGCTKCSQDCPVKAIPFTPYEKHEIDQSICIKCDNCRIVCPVVAIEIVNIND